MPEADVVIEIFGEGKTDVGRSEKTAPRAAGVVPIIVHTLCGRPEQMRVKRRGVPFLQQRETGKGLWQKVRFAGRQARANRSHAVVFVVDSEGDLKGKRAALVKGREAATSKLPMAIGVAHPCIEAWLLADAMAIRRGMGLDRTPAVPDNPEALPAPCRNNAKRVLVKAAGSTKKELSAAQKDDIARAMNNMQLARDRCPAGFAPFADEVEQKIRPLF